MQSTFYLLRFLPSLLFFIVLITPVSIFADTLYMKDGSQRSGTIVGQTRSTVRLKGLDGKVVTVPKSQIKRILFDSIADEREQKKKREEERRKKEAEKKRKEAEARRKAEEEKRRKLEAEKQKKEESKKRRQEERQQKRADPITRMEAFKRSAMLPGWGQWSRGEKYKGGLFGGGMAFFLYLTYEQNRFVRNTTRDTESMFNPSLATASLYWATNTSPNPTPDQLRDPVGLWLYTQPFEKQHAKLERQVKDLRLLVFGVLALYGWNLADAWYFHPAPRVHLQTDPRLGQGQSSSRIEVAKVRNALLAGQGQSLASLPGSPEYLGVPIRSPRQGWEFLPVWKRDGEGRWQTQAAGPSFGAGFWGRKNLRQEFVFRRTFLWEDLF